MIYHSDSTDKNIFQIQHLVLFCYVINAVLMIHLKKEKRKRLEIRHIRWKKLLPSDLKVQNLFCSRCNSVRFPNILILQMSKLKHREVECLVHGHT